MPLIPAELPEPDADARAHCSRVRAAISDAIRTAGGAIPFSDYMRLTLYAPGLGYYRAGAEKFGAGGDFVTAPDVSPLFGTVIARQAAQVLHQTGGDTFLELGAGSGRLALQILRQLAEANQLPERYLILEISAELAARQRALLATEPGIKERVEWLDHLPEKPLRGVILANEVADALPVECFRYRKGRIARLGVREVDGQFAWCDMPAPTWLADRAGALAERHGWRDGYISEVCPDLAPWIAGLASLLERGMVLLFDYGLPEREYYHPQRSMGTLMCHYRHRAHEDPFLWPGLCDITAWVDFTALARAAKTAGLVAAGFTTQANFLLGGGIVETLTLAGNERERLQLAGEIKRLTLPSEMGEAFKAIALTRACDPPPAFGFRNLVSRL